MKKYLCKDTHFRLLFSIPKNLYVFLPKGYDGIFLYYKTIGILGGGQLGKMLFNTTRQWDIQTHVMDPSAQAPARIGSNAFVQGDLMDYETVIEFWRKS